MMSKVTATTATVDTKLVSHFSLLTFLTFAFYLLFSPMAFAATDCNTLPQGSQWKDCEYTDPNTGQITTYDSNGNASAPSSGSPSVPSVTSLTGVSSIICDVVYLLIFDIGRGIATLSIIAVGIAAMYGKASWGQAVTVGVGIGIIFGSLALTTLLTANLTSILSGSASVPCIPSLSSLTSVVNR